MYPYPVASEEAHGLSSSLFNQGFHKPINSCSASLFFISFKGPVKSFLWHAFVSGQARYFRGVLENVFYFEKP
jgi:hypothetical protein